MKDTWRPAAYPLPDGEPERLAALAALEILDTPPEPFFQDVVELAAQCCGTPIALVSLVDAKRQWFKAARGLTGVRETPREHSLCAHAIVQPELMVVEDTRSDPRFRDNPLVAGEPGIRMYAGMPLRSPAGHGLGTLCVIDRRPRGLTVRQRRALEMLAGVVAAKLDMRRHHVDAANMRAQLQQILDNVPALISCRDTRLRYEFVNRALAARLDRAAETLIGLGPDEALEPELAARHLPLVLRALGGETVRETHEERTADGSLHVMQLRYQPALDARGRIHGVYGFHQDVSDLVRMEHEIRVLNGDLERRVAARTAELADALAQLEMFAYAIAHDLRAPVRRVAALADLVAEQADARDVAAAVREAGRLRVAARDLAALVDGLQRLTRVSSEALSIVDVELAPLVAEAWSRVANDLARERVRLVVGPLPRCRADRVLLTQALVNLLDNAVKFSAGREQPRIEVAAHAVAGAVELSIGDNGVGFAAEHASRLFRPFARLHAAADFAGTGVGLAIVERIMRRHGGSVRASAAAGAGASFHLTLPRVPEDAASR